MKQLYMIGLGGSIGGANVEIHDMQFVYADSLEGCYDTLKKRWYGDYLHIDSYTVLHHIDGFDITFDTISEQNLYMIVYGGYINESIDELHQYHFLRAHNPAEAKIIAKQDIVRFPKMNHVDEIVDVFDNAGVRFGFYPSTHSFTDNTLTHTFIKLIHR